jgi:hypothetical protein
VTPPLVQFSAAIAKDTETVAVVFTNNGGAPYILSDISQV